LVARLLREQEVAGSSPVAPTIPSTPEIDRIVVGIVGVDE
jgi:hypothetical protein